MRFLLSTVHNDILEKSFKVLKEIDWDEHGSEISYGKLPHYLRKPKYTTEDLAEGESPLGRFEGIKKPFRSKDILSDKDEQANLEWEKEGAEPSLDFEDTDHRGLSDKNLHEWGPMADWDEGLPPANFPLVGAGSLPHEDISDLEMEDLPSSVQADVPSHKQSSMLTGTNKERELALQALRSAHRGGEIGTADMDDPAEEVETDELDILRPEDGEPKMPVGRGALEALAEEYDESRGLGGKEGRKAQYQSDKEIADEFYGGTGWGDTGYTGSSAPTAAIGPSDTPAKDIMERYNKPRQKTTKIRGKEPKGPAGVFTGMSQKKIGTPEKQPRRKKKKRGVPVVSPKRGSRRAGPKNP